MSQMRKILMYDIQLFIWRQIDLRGAYLYIVACQRGWVSPNRSGSDKTRGQGSLKRNEPHTWFAFLGWAWHVTIYFLQSVHPWFTAFKRWNHWTDGLHIWHANWFPLWKTDFLQIKVKCQRSKSKIIYKWRKWSFKGIDCRLNLT